MDGPRITHFHHRFQDLTILTVLLLILKQHIPSLSSKEVEDQKHRLWILLNDSTTTLDHLGDHFTYLSSSTATPSTSFSALLTTFLSMDHPVFQQVQRQLRSICLECVNTDASSCIKLKKSDLMGLGCIEIHSELLTLAQQLKMFFLHQRNTYAVLYNVIYYVWQQNWEMGEEA
ncbi:hypothetical protein HMI55_003666 [Coelomomyces lativittatus]|nr:hypothetical protein HMI55_003666 [Coelomomyces lativittatus]KAJ1502283.1 hypothetical protein HMI56_002771 [Coelomomyces lativittatus]